MSTMRVLVFGALLALACSPRELVLGGQVDAGPMAEPDQPVSLRPATPPAALPMAECSRFTALPVVPDCVGFSSPAPYQCVLSHRPDGGVTVVAALSRTEDAFIRKVFGVQDGRVFVEVTDAPVDAMNVELRSYSFSSDAGAVHAQSPSGSELVAAALSPGGIDLVACSSRGCELRAVPLDGGMPPSAVTSVPRPTSETLARGPTGDLAYPSASGVVHVSRGVAQLVSDDPSGLAAFAPDGALLVTVRDELVRRTTEPQTLGSGLDEPRGLFVIGAFAVVVEARRIRAFPQSGSAGPLTLYELSNEPGTLDGPRLVNGRLVFEQVCQAAGSLSADVEVDVSAGRSRWLNTEPTYPFIDGASPRGVGPFVWSSGELMLRLLD